ncbi:hypothetical protein SEVIR_6G180450v4 [Setaria viridis]
MSSLREGAEENESCSLFRFAFPPLARVPPCCRCLFFLRPPRHRAGGGDVRWRPTASNERPGAGFRGKPLSVWCYAGGVRPPTVPRASILFRPRHRAVALSLAVAPALVPAPAPHVAPRPDPNAATATRGAARPLVPGPQVPVFSLPSLAAGCCGAVRAHNDREQSEESPSVSRARITDAGRSMVLWRGRDVTAEGRPSATATANRVRRFCCGAHFFSLAPLLPKSCGLV